MRAALTVVAGAAGVAGMPSGPVAKVTKMLYDMQKELEADSKADEASYAKMQCWCKKTVPAKEKAIAEAQACQKSETAKIDSAKGRISTAETNIAELTEQIDTETEALETMTDMRRKTQTAFEKAQKELVQTVSALAQAVEVLKKHNTGFLQAETSGKAVLSRAQRLLKERVSVMGAHVNSVINPSQRQALTSFLAQPTFDAYSSASGQVFGMLQSMHDEFTKDLAEAQEADAADADAFAKGKVIKEKLIKDAKAAKAKNEASLVEAKEELGNAEAQLAACTETLDSEQKMLAEVIADCQQNVKDYEQRTADRAVEMKAVDTAIAFLDSDEARDLFADTFSFVQERLGNQSEQKAAEAKARRGKDLLSQVGKKWKDVKVTILAQKVRAGAFDKIIVAIDEIVKELKLTIKTDQAQFDGCNEFINAKTKLVHELEGELETLAAQADTLQTGIDELKAAIAALQEDVATATQQMNQAAEERKEASTAFRTEQANNDAALKLLTKTKEVLAGAFTSSDGAYTSAAAGAALVQQEPSKPDEFKQYEVNQGGNKVLEMIQGIMDDTEKAMKDALTQENMEQKSYEDLVHDQNALIVSYQKQISEKDGEMAQKETELSQNQKTTKAMKETHGVESNLLSGKKEECAFILGSIGVRKAHMNGEIKALNDAQAFLNNMQ
ncbi:unnamed protein product [Amoebophrya sp. A25]|nr:unnamed protein product [Amoebophrya sp. A25]|eukprot:GSA25T00013422001.1